MNINDIDINGYETLFLDRDGVINILRPNDYVKCWQEFIFAPGILEALARWNQHLKHIIVFTNQRGVGRGLMTEEDLLDINNRMIAEIKKYGGRIDKIYYCTALSDDNPCRKPNPGMALNAKLDFPDIEFNKTLMIGDSESDAAFAYNIHCKFILIQ